MLNINITDPQVLVRAASEAGRLRKEFGASNVLPVDSVLLANKLGLSVAEVRLPRGVAAAIVKDEGHDALILLKRGLAKSQLRYLCALELGRYAYYTEVGPDTYVDYALADAVDPLSQLAQSFADELTMPAARVMEMQAEHTPVSLMASRFDVELEVFSQRLKRLECSALAPAYI